MINVERLLLPDWYVECNTEQDVDHALHVCRKIGISSDEIEEMIKILGCPIEIGFSRFFDTIEYAHNKAFEILELKNITASFFRAVPSILNK